MKNAIVVAMMLLGVTAAIADEKTAAKPSASEASGDAAALAAMLPQATVSLASALEAAEKSGTPISARFEVEDGKLQLSVFTMKADKFAEVIVDHKTGKVTKTDAITSGDDLTDAKKQAAAMQKTKLALKDVVKKVEKANAGFKITSVTPSADKDAASAEIAMLRGTESRVVTEKL